MELQVQSNMVSNCCSVTEIQFTVTVVGVIAPTERERERECDN